MSGACLLNNEPPGLRDAMLKDRISGKSWKQISEDYELGNPAAARARFKEVTGLTDFRSKGDDLQRLIAQQFPEEIAKKATTRENVQAGVRRWTSGTDDEFIGQMRGYYAGRTPDREDVLALIDKVETSPLTERTLYRGIRIRDDAVQAFSETLQPGTEVDFPMSSWSSSRSVADDFAQTSSPLSQSLVVEVRPGVRAFDIENIPGNVYPEQREWIMSGKTKVVSRSVDERGTIRVVLEPAE